jgi:hypothetical protein
MKVCDFCGKSEPEPTIQFGSEKDNPVVYRLHLHCWVTYLNLYGKGEDKAEKVD